MPACRGVSDPTGGLSHTNVLSEGLPMVLKVRLPGQELQNVRNIHDCTRLPCEGMLNVHGSDGGRAVLLSDGGTRGSLSLTAEEPGLQCKAFFPSSSELNICRYMSISFAYCG